MLKPLVPVFIDFWDHEFNEIEHISIVHAKYGSHHLQKEVADTESGCDAKNQATLPAQDQVPFHLLTVAYSPAVPAAFSCPAVYFYQPAWLPLISLTRQGPPPKFS